MRKVGIAVLGLALGGAFAGGGVALASSGAHQITTAQTMQLREHDTHQAFVDVNHNNRPDPGDQFVFAGTLTNTSTHKQVGTVNGHCTITFLNQSICDGTGAISGQGQIEVSGQNDGNAKHFNVAITGGTGQYQNARGEMHIDQVNDTDSIDTLHLIP